MLGLICKSINSTENDIQKGKEKDSSKFNKIKLK